MAGARRQVFSISNMEMERERRREGGSRTDGSGQEERKGDSWAAGRAHFLYYCSIGLTAACLVRSAI